MVSRLTRLFDDRFRLANWLLRFESLDVASILKPEAPYKTHSSEAWRLLFTLGMVGELQTIDGLVTAICKRMNTTCLFDHVGTCHGGENTWRVSFSMRQKPNSNFKLGRGFIRSPTNQIRNQLLQSSIFECVG